MLDELELTLEGELLERLLDEEDEEDVEELEETEDEELDWEDALERDEDEVLSTSA